MYIEASLMRPGDKARLLTSDLRGSSSPQCLVFYHHMYGSGTGILSVLLRRADGQRDTLLWRRRGEQSVSWMRAMVDYHCDVRHQVRQRGINAFKSYFQSHSEKCIILILTPALMCYITAVTSFSVLVKKTHLSANFKYVCRFK